VTLHCEVCDCPFQAPNHRIVGKLIPGTPRGSRPRFCSSKCFGETRKTKPDLPHIVERREIYQWRQSLGWNPFSISWIKSHPQCAACGAAKVGRNLVVHHPVDPNADRSEDLLFRPSNLVVLCRSCHASLHQSTLGS
jgi:5-methylcytosine-specific restriction endonuclease McrA